MFVATLVDLSILDRIVVLVECLGDGDGEVGEVDVLVLRAGPSSVAACSPSRSIIYRMA